MGQEATPIGSRSQLFFAFIWLTTTALLLGAFQTISIPQALGDDSLGLVDTGGSDYALMGLEPSADEQPSALYGGLHWTVTEVRVTPTEELLGHAVIEVDLELTNTLSTLRLRVSDREVVLRTRDDHVITGGRFADSGKRLAIEAGETKSVTYVATTGYDKNPNPRDLALVVGEANRIPATIPLVGNEEPDESSIFVAVDPTPFLLEDPDDAQRQIVVEPVAATLGINAGPYRAALGERLALVKVNVQRSTTLETASFLETGFWSMVADGTQVAPIVVTRTSEPTSNSDEVTLLFAFPESATDLSLAAGIGSAKSGSFDLVIPAGD